MGTPHALAGTGTKRCTLCKLVKPEEDFYRTKRSLHSRCRVCMSASARDWFANNPERVAARARRKNLRQYGLTEASYAAMLAAQGGVCAICREPQDFRALAVDHCHTTGRVRALLCCDCNLRLGWFEKLRDRGVEFERYLNQYTEPPVVP